MRSLSRLQVLALLLAPLGCSSEDGLLPKVSDAIDGEAYAATRTQPDLAAPAEPDCEVPSLTSAAEEHEMSALYPAACVEERFGDDGCPDTRVTRAFDAAGRVAKEVFEVLDPSLNAYTYVPLVSHVRTLTYDAEGRVVLEEMDEQLDGSVDGRITRRYDDAGRLREQRHEWPQRHWDLHAGAFEHRTFDEEGREIELVYSAGDGTRMTTVRTFTSDGRPLLDETTSDHPELAEYVHRTEWTYADDGRPLTKAYVHHTGSGSVTSSVLTWIYEGERAVRTEERSSFIGAYTYAHSGDRVVVTELDERGNAVRVEEDAPADGVLDRITTRTFDGAGREIAVRVTDGGGTLVSHATYAYDVEGRLLESRWRPAHGLGEPTWHSERRGYDDGGRLTSVERRADGVITSVQRFEHDALGQPTRETTDWDGDGVVDHGRRWSRDGQGNLRSIRVEQGDTGMLEARLGYACLEPAAM